MQTIYGPALSRSKKYALLISDILSISICVLRKPWKRKRKWRSSFSSCAATRLRKIIQGGGNRRASYLGNKLCRMRLLRSKHRIALAKSFFRYGYIYESSRWWERCGKKKFNDDKTIVAYSKVLERIGESRKAENVLQYVLNSRNCNEYVIRRLAQLKWRRFAKTVYMELLSGERSSEAVTLAVDTENLLNAICRSNELNSWNYNRSRRRLAFERIDHAYERRDRDEIELSLKPTCGSYSASVISKGLTEIRLTDRARQIIVDPNNLYERVDNGSSFMNVMKGMNSSAYLWKSGFIENSFGVREACLKRVFETFDKSKVGLASYIRHLAEMECYGKDGFIENQSEPHLLCHAEYWERHGSELAVRVEECQRHQVLIEHGVGAFVNGNENRIDYDWTFREIIDGKSVAIIGGGYDVDLSELNEFEVLIFVGTKRPEHDVRDRLVFLSVGATPGRFLKDDYDWLLGLKEGGVFGFIGSRNLSLGKPDGLGYHAKGRMPELWSGSLNHGFGLIYDVYRYNPRRVKIFGMDFYMSDKVYRDGYAATKRDLSLKTILMQANHDNISQRRFVHNLVGMVGLEVDDRCRDVLTLPDSAYISALSDIVSRLGNERFNRAHEPTLS